MTSSRGGLRRDAPRTSTRRRRPCRPRRFRKGVINLRVDVDRLRAWLQGMWSVAFAESKEWALGDSNPRPQPCESVKSLFARQLDTTPYDVIRNNDGTKRREKTARDAICGAFCGARSFDQCGHSFAPRCVFQCARTSMEYATATANVEPSEHAPFPLIEWRCIRNSG
jgi:hypothetical protein